MITSTSDFPLHPLWLLLGLSLLLQQGYAQLEVNDRYKFPYQPNDCATQPENNIWTSEVLSVRPVNGLDYNQGTEVCLSLAVKPDGQCTVYNDNKWNVTGPNVPPNTLPGMPICCNPSDPRLEFYKLRVNTNCKCRSAFNRVAYFYPNGLSNTSTKQTTKPLAFEAVNLTTATYDSRGRGDVFLTRYDTKSRISTSQIQASGGMAICFQIEPPCATLADIATFAAKAGGDRARGVVQYALYTPRLATGLNRPVNFYECCPSFNINMADVCTETGVNTTGCDRVTSDIDDACPTPTSGRRLRASGIAPSYVDGKNTVVDLEIRTVH